MNDAAIGSIVLVGDMNWRRGPFWPSMAALAFGRRERFVHMGLRCTIAWWKDKPYLIGLRKVPT